MLYTSLKQLSFHVENRRYQISDLKLSSSLESITKHLELKTKKLNEPACVFIYGEPGCGRTALLLNICDTLLNNKLKVSEIFGVRVRPGCTVESLWNLLIEMAKERQDRDTASLLSLSTVKLKKKYKIAQDFISSNFKLVCVDDAFADGGIVWSHLSQLVDKTDICVIVVSTTKESHFLNTTGTKQPALSVEIKGLNFHSFMKSFDQFSCWNFSEEQIVQMYSALNGNAAALNIFINVVNEFQLPQESTDCFFVSAENQILQQSEQDVQSSAILNVLQFLFQHLTAYEKHVYGQLCELREPLPVVNVSEEIEKFVRLGVVSKQAINVHENKRASDAIFSISVAPCLQLSSTQLTYSSLEVQVHFSAFDAWYALLSSKLHVLITDAERNAWPFVPEKWQYVSSAGAEERYNIKELITAKNSVVPSSTEQDILEECLFHAVKEKKYSSVAALVFVMDRFTYWQGISQTTLQLVEYLKTNSPTTPIAPQLLIRNVRIMKNAGNLQGAEKVLDELLVQETEIGKWIYKNKQDHHLVSAVCIQIKGDIQYNLGQWSQGAKLLIESLILFSTLPIPDTKGISASLAILGNCLQQMTVTEYIPLCQMYGLTASHPLLQAYYCACEAAMRSQYTPLFYARHKCRAGEFVLRYSQLNPSGAQRQEHLNISIEDFKDSIQAHKDLQSLTSREEFYVFVCAVYKLGLAYQELSSEGSNRQGQDIVKMSMLMYEHYCSFTGIILLDDNITTLIAHCLSFLKLNQFSVEVLGSSSLPVEFNACEETDKLTFLHSGEISRMDCPGNVVQRSFNAENEEFTFANHKAVLKERNEGHVVTDSLKETQVYKAADFSSIVSCSIPVYSGRMPQEKNASESDNNLTIDRDCDTKEVNSTERGLFPASINTSALVDRCVVTMETVDPSIVTQQLEQETVCLPCERFVPHEMSTVQSHLQNMKLDSRQRVQGAIVWRFDSMRYEWKGEKTLACVGNLLELEEGKKGAQRNAFMVEFVNQEDPLAKYVAKRYKKSKNVKQYQQDVICQMTARYYVTLFNEQLHLADVNVGHIQFLPVVLLQLVDDESGLLSGDVCNVEPYMAGEFVKLTNNFNYVRKEDEVSELVVAFSHFTYQASNQLLVIVDIQGWTPATDDKRACTFLTDPQIHSVRYQCFGTGNLRQHGIDSFWKQMHPQCNNICTKLRLVRPDVTK